MGRGNQRIHEGAKDEPYLRYRLRGLQGKGLRCFKLDRIFQQLNLNTNHSKLTRVLHLSELRRC
jgi:hypothetical protein